MAQTPTIQDIISSYQEGVGSGGTNTALLLQALRNRQIRAGEEDKQTAKSFHSGGKAFLSGSKHARDFFSMFQGFSGIFSKHAKKIPSVFEKDTRDP